MSLEEVFAWFTGPERAQVDPLVRHQTDLRAYAALEHHLQRLANQYQFAPDIRNQAAEDVYTTIVLWCSTGQFPAINQIDAYVRMMLYHRMVDLWRGQGPGDPPEPPPEPSEPEPGPSWPPDYARSLFDELCELAIGLREPQWKPPLAQALELLALQVFENQSTEDLLRREGIDRTVDPDGFKRGRDRLQQRLCRTRKALLEAVQYMDDPERQADAQIFVDLLCQKRSC